MIEFILNNKKITTDASKSMTLVDFIRHNSNLKGTKIVCQEGDCGACTVLIGELLDGNIKYHSITSCISPLANAHGKHVVTVEGLNLDKQLNKVQQSLKNNHASQCGFCTPGFVIAMINYCLNNNTNTDQQMLDAISGNICRCTGYVAIINSARELVESSKSQGKKYTIRQLIQYNFIPAYFADIPQQLAQLNQNNTNMAEKIIAGGTDLYVQQAQKLLQTKSLRFIILEQSAPIEISNNICSISATATVSDMFFNHELNNAIANWQQYLRLVSSEAIRNMATIAGNFVNASPIGDMSIIMLALKAKLHLQTKDTGRTITLKKFFIDYKKVALNADESISRIEFNIPDGHCFNFEKVSKRTHLDIATVNTAIHIQLDNNEITEINIAMGGVAAIPKYLTKTCKYLQGRHINPKTLRLAIKVMHKEIAPISDIRGTATYKRLLAEQLFKAHFIKLFPQQITFNQVVNI
ncbi:Xanthine dehydrogenase iron-sulfur subunit / Xanthine dehydrogenase, FAD binding subunit [hydrothermal vent metagenome]|uniref:Xanthine dehydrogenase iron-sulfur subunit / Xanthine dehydrogenase, FAD binding subunit n=1 Tax=hydrothermal vent metagenome TaxID=652676 RepID=A0A3B0VRP9_9ZZZZ